LGESFEGGQRKLLSQKPRGKDASCCLGTRINPHHPAYKLCMTVKHDTDGSIRSTVSDQDDGLICRAPELIDEPHNRGDLIIESLRRTLRVISVEAGQRHSGGERISRFQVLQDFIPRPSA